MTCFHNVRNQARRITKQVESLEALALPGLRDLLGTLDPIGHDFAPISELPNDADIDLA